MLRRYEWEDLKPSQVNYGCFPRSLIDPEVHRIEVITEENDDIFRQWESMQNAYEQAGDGT